MAQGLGAALKVKALRSQGLGYTACYTVLYPTSGPITIIYQSTLNRQQADKTAASGLFTDTASSVLHF